MVESSLTTTLANSLWSLECISFHHRLMYIQVHLVVTSLIFFYFSSSCGRNFAPAISVLLSIHLRSVEGEVATEDWGRKWCWVPQPSPHLLLPVKQNSLSGDTPPLIFLFWLTYLWKPSHYSLHPLPSSVSPSPWPSWPHLYTNVLCLYNLLNVFVLVSIACMLVSFPLV